jgi:hypothetical protein
VLQRDTSELTPESVAMVSLVMQQAPGIERSVPVTMSFKTNKIVVCFVLQEWVRTQGGTWRHRSPPKRPLVFCAIFWCHEATGIFVREINFVLRVSSNCLVM